MKKVFLTAIAVLGFMTTQAQEVRFGAKAGLNMASIDSNDDEGIDLSSRIGLHIGAFAEIMLSDKFAFQPELLYSTQGSKYDYSQTDSGFGYEIVSTNEGVTKLDYINIPLMAKYFATEKFFIEAGPQVGFVINKTAEVDYSIVTTFGGTSTTQSGSESSDLEDVSSLDFGLNFGLGYDFTENIFASARYNLGLGNVYDGEGDYEQKNRVFSVSLGYKF